MQSSRLHEFHFVLNRGMKDKILNIGFFNGSKSVSGMIVNILKVMTPVMGKEHKWGEQRMTRYAAVCNDPEEIRDHVHVYVPDELYRELKLLHQDLNFYSIAQLVRELLDFFLGLVDVYKNKVFLKLKKIFARWKAEDEDTRLTPRKSIRQLLKLIRFLPGKNRLITIYDNNYSPFWILRI
ncbi:MAG: hypothetical protein JXJ04_08775 [Spirochaetales bacterium]|nr:hypothetical protein [Spirochaetales bacterium]